MANNLNISSVISPDILKTVSSSTVIKTFGDQLKNQAKETIISVARNKVGELEQEIQNIIQEEIAAGVEYNNRIKQINDNKSQYPSEELYQKDLEAEKISYESQKISFKARIDQLKLSIKNILSDPYSKIKEEQKATRNRIRLLKKRTKDTEAISKINLSKQVALNSLKTLAPIISLQLANQFGSVISQRKKLEDLVNQINEYIDTQVNDTQTAAIATNLRNNAVSLINNNIKKLENLQNTLKRISTTITIFSTIISVLSAIPIPTSVPPGVGIPVSLIIRIVKSIERANKLISALGAILAISTVLLTNEINQLNALIERLKEVSLKLDGKSIDSLSTLSDLFLPTGLDYPPYKGFNFKIKEEQDPRFVVKGNKRKYAVAINKRGIEQIKSEFSFTQDPNDLIEQLKLVIDQQNLQG